MMYLWTGSDDKENGAREHETSDTTSTGGDFHRFDEQVNVCLDCCDVDMRALPRKYIR